MGESTYKQLVIKFFFALDNFYDSKFNKIVSHLIICKFYHAIWYLNNFANVKLIYQKKFKFFLHTIVSIIHPSILSLNENKTLREFLKYQMHVVKIMFSAAYFNTYEKIDINLAVNLKIV